MGRKGTSEKPGPWGMRVGCDQLQNSTTDGLPNVYSQARSTRRTVHVRYGSGRAAFSLALTSHLGVEPDEAPIKLDQIKISDWAFTVGDVKALAESLFTNRVEKAAPLEAFATSEGQLNIIFGSGPDGILPQFDQHG